MDSGRPGLDEIHEAFARFPAPLALASAEAGLLRVNAAWSRRFGGACLVPETLGEMAASPGGIRLLRLRTPGNGKIAEARARAIPVAGRIALVAEEAGAEGPEDVLDRLRGRIAELERLAATDHLTGAWNRAHFERTIEVELARSRASRTPLSLVLLDIDRFKRVNDTFGHAAGDAVLRDLVVVAKARIRASDLLFRWGGEEFAVLVSSAGYRGAERVADTLRQAVAAHAFEGVGHLTLSAGVAEHDGEESPDDWFARLDTALYLAKAGGRDRVVVDRRGSSDGWAAQTGRSALRLAWQEAYECGEATIDAEHRELFERANRLIEASLDVSGGRAAFLLALDGLIEHVARHFADEEAILARVHYGDLEPHRLAHEGLVRRALWLRERVKSGEAGVGDVVGFLAQDVVARHMLTMDRAFYPLFERRNG